MEVVELGGRKFQTIANGPIKFDFWMASLVKECGIDSLNMESGQTPGDFVDALLARLMETGKSMEILGGMLAPAELDLRKWTPEVAAESTAFIEQLIEPADKEIVKGMIAEVLIGFFRSGLASLTTSRTALTAGERARATEPGPMTAGL